MCDIFTVKDLKMLEMMTGSLLKKITEPGLEIDPEMFEKLVAADGAAGDGFGASVAVSNTSVVVGAGAQYRKNAVYVY